MWTTWGAWGSCSGTCNTNTRTRSMLYSGNLPCTGVSSETGNCQSKDQIVHKLKRLTSTIHYNLAFKISLTTEKLNFTLSVEGAWTTWGNWGSCSGTCNSNTRIRSMLYNGNLPCTGTSSQTGNCQSEAACLFSKLIYYVSFICF